MARHHVIQISDLHLSEDRSYNQPGWEACLRFINETAPDFVAVTGDLVLDDPDRTADHGFVRGQLDRIVPAWAAVPGNHDVGDTNPRPYMGQHFDEGRLQRYEQAFGADHWARPLGRWLLIGLNAFLPGSGLAGEEEQYRWLEGILAAAPDRPKAVFLHKPLCLDTLAEEDRPDTCVTREGRDALYRLLRTANVRFVASGHNHHYRAADCDGMAMIWAPATAQILRMPRPFTALLKPGLVSYRLDDDGTMAHDLIEPAGMVATDITDLIGRHGAMRRAPIKPWQR